MTTTTITPTGPSQLLAAELRAEIARQGLNMAEMSRRLGVPQAWVSRRIGRGADVDLTLEEVVKMSQALDVSVEHLLGGLLPRLDSNQQPSGYLFPLVRTRSDLELVA